MVKISVIMSVYGDSGLVLRKSVESILKQSFDDFEFIIVIDNPENTDANRYLSKISKSDSRIKLILNDCNQGLAKSLNKAITMSKGKYIARMDADDVATKERFLKQISFMESNPATDFLFTWTKYINDKGKSVGDFSPSDKLTSNLKKNFFLMELFSHPTLLVNAAVLKKLKYGSKFRYSQDLDLWLRGIRKGYRFRILEDYLLEYRIPEVDLEYRIVKYKRGSKYSISIFNYHVRNYYGNLFFWVKYFKYLSQYVFLNIIPLKCLVFIARKKNSL